MRHIAIAGAGIGGLTAALALAERGCRVDVYERTAAAAEVGAGVQLSPNAAIVLDRLGILDTLRPRSIEPREVLIRRAGDGRALARIPLGPPAALRYGAPFLVTLRADLQGALAARAAAHPAIRLRFGHGVTGWEDRPDGVSIRFSDAARPAATADALVGADGIRSAVRHQIRRADRDDAVASGRSAWRCLVPRADADADALLPRSNLWLGRRSHLVHYPVDGGDRVNVVAIVDEPLSAVDDRFWSMPAAADDIAARFAGWAAPARRLVTAASNWRRWPLFDRPPLRQWSRGPVTLLGDAAHPMLPFLAQGAAQAIEDAAVLADCVERSPDDLATAFVDYEGLRRGRTARVQMESRRQGTIYHLGPPASLMRDLVLSALPPDRLGRRYDWIYSPPVEVCRFARP